MNQTSFLLPSEPQVQPKAVLYPNHYVWFVFLSALDLMLTWIILHRGGGEVNLLASSILGNWGLIGFVVYKFILVTLVLCICEYVGRKNRALGRKLATAGVVITSFPIVVAFGLLWIHFPHLPIEALPSDELPRQLVSEPLVNLH
ncbi:MAG: hypothetical protein HJJLKODD_01529 [Phycisphaerae bacterium]|nr:hypothetical protein [Phycisphaerae bacterium]